MKHIKNIKTFLIESTLTKNEILPYIVSNFPIEIIDLINKDFINYLYELKVNQFPELNCRIILKLNNKKFLEDDEIVLLLSLDYDTKRFNYKSYLDDNIDILEYINNNSEICYLISNEIHRHKITPHGDLETVLVDIKELDEILKKSSKKFSIKKIKGKGYSYNTSMFLFYTYKNEDALDKIKTFNNLYPNFYAKSDKYNL